MTHISAFLPGSMLPTWSDNFNAAAPLNVAAVIASSGVILICVHAIVIIICMLYDIHDPGLKSDARATAAPASISFRAGA